MMTPGQASITKGKYMNANYRRVPTRFGPETGFEVRPNRPAPCRAREEADLERLKARLLAEQLEERGDAQLSTQLRRAADEAAALAWGTGYPLLGLSTLFLKQAGAALLP